MITVDSHGDFVTGEIRYTVTVRTTTWTVLTQLYDRFDNNSVNYTDLTVGEGRRTNKP